METKTVPTTEVAWEPLTAFPGEGRVKVLRDEGGAKARTLLIRIEAGGEIIAHAHEAAVQHYILEGQYESEGQTYHAGTYRLLPGHENVAPISTQTGTTILMIYDPVR